VTAIEVSDISSGKLTPTVMYSVSGGISDNSFAVVLSPDNSRLYILNLPNTILSPNTVAAAGFFDKTIGRGLIRVRGGVESTEFLSVPRIGTSE